MHTALDPFVAAELTYRRERLLPDRGRSRGAGSLRRRARRTPRPTSPTAPAAPDLAG